MLKHFKDFNAHMGLKLDASVRVAVAVSGGVDSIALVELLRLSGVRHIRLLHVDHGTRAQIADEVRLIKKLATKCGHKFTSLKLSLDLASSNFESLARTARYQALLANLASDEVLLTGHHLDDCFEWSLMQQLKSSAKAIDLGIPYRNGRIYRPLFAFSKKQVQSFARVMQLEWLEDASNKDVRFERNYIRDLVQNLIAPRYPQYIKHYCVRMNKLKKIGVSNSKVTTRRRQWGELIVHNGIIGEELERKILSIGHLKRGKTREQFNKLAEMINNGKIGPLTFSGGLRVYVIGDFLAVVRDGHDLKFSRTSSQIPEAVPFLSQVARAKDSLKKCPLDNASLQQAFSDLASPVHYSWRKAGKVLVWL